MPDAPWITNYERYFNMYYQCVEVSDEDENEMEDDEE